VTDEFAGPPNVSLFTLTVVAVLGREHVGSLYCKLLLELLVRPQHADARDSDGHSLRTSCRRSLPGPHTPRLIQIARDSGKQLIRCVWAALSCEILNFAAHENEWSAYAPFDDTVRSNRRRAPGTRLAVMRQSCDLLDVARAQASWSRRTGLCMDGSVSHRRYRILVKGRFCLGSIAQRGGCVVDADAVGSESQLLGGSSRLAVGELIVRCQFGHCSRM